MANTSLSPELVELVQQLANSFAKNEVITSAKASIASFYQSPEATDLFRKVNEYGEELRNKHMAGMTPGEEEISRFDEMRQAVVENEICHGFLQARQQIDELLGTVNQYLCLAIDMGQSPSDEEVAAALQQQQAGGGCGCGCSGDGGCDSESCENENCNCSH